MNKPNIFYIHSHDTGCYVQPYGHAIPTSLLLRASTNGTDDEKYLNVLKNMHRRLERWREETDEPLLEEPIMSPPKTTVVNDPDDLLPTSAMHPARDFMRI